MVHGRQFLLGREGDDLIAARVEEWVTNQQHRRDALLRQRRKGGVQLGVSACVDEGERLTNRTHPLCQLQRLLGSRREPHRID